MARADGPATRLTERPSPRAPSIAPQTMEKLNTAGNVAQKEKYEGELKKTIKKVERVYGITIRAKVKKNKVGMSFREAEFDFLFGFGVDDHGASVHWLKEIGRLGDIDVKDTEFKAYLQEVAEMDDAAFKAEVKAVSDTVKRVWAEVENTFIPVRKKYA